MALQLAGQFGLTAVRVVQLALRVVAGPLGFELARAQILQACGGGLDVRFEGFHLCVQRADFALAGEHAHLVALRATHARPTRPQPFAGTGDYRLPEGRRRKLGKSLPRFVQRFGSYYMTQNHHGGHRTAHLRGQRADVGWPIALGGIEQGDVGLFERAECAGRVSRIVYQHAVHEAGQHGFHRGFPAGFHLQRLAQPACLAEAEPLQPRAGRGFILAERGVLQGFQ